MHLYIHIMGKQIPSYGLLITIGILTANIIAFKYIKKTAFDINDFLILEAYCLLGGAIGAKLLYVILSFRTVDWKSIQSITDWSVLINSGFVFYGGLIGGIIALYAGGRIHKIKTGEYIRNFIFMLPMIHAFGRLGCHMAGCCYGKPYSGIGAVVFPENSLAVPGIELFPVQLTEAGVLALITAVLFIVIKKSLSRQVLELYLIMYGTARFFMEYLRYDDIRGIFGPFSTSQWISLGLILFSVISVVKKRFGFAFKKKFV